MAKHTTNQNGIRIRLCTYAYVEHHSDSLTHFLSAEKKMGREVNCMLEELASTQLIVQRDLTLTKPALAVVFVMFALP